MNRGDSMDTTTIKNGAAYIRVSTDKQEELSPDAQKRMILEYAKKNINNPPFNICGGIRLSINNVLISIIYLLYNIY